MRDNGQGHLVRTGTAPGRIKDLLACVEVKKFQHLGGFFGVAQWKTLCLASR